MTLVHIATRLARSLGEMLRLLDELDLAQNTLAMFTSGKGPRPERAATNQIFC